VFSGHGSSGGGSGFSNGESTSNPESGTGFGSADPDPGNDSDGQGSGNTGDPAPPVNNGQRWATHIVSITVPSDVTASGCDANNDGVVTSADGQVNALIGLAEGLGQDFNGQINAGIEEGKMVMLAELIGYKGGDQTGFDLVMYLGEVADPGCSDTNDDGTMCPWLIAAEAYDEAGEPAVKLPGARVTASHLASGPHNFKFTLPLGGVNLPITIQTGRVSGDIDGGFDLNNGRLCGQIGKDDLKQALDNACIGPDADPNLCGLKDVVVSLLDCSASPDPNLCSLVIELEGVEAESLEDAP